jgi:glycerate-2-kinase
LDDARATIINYDLASALPASVVDFLMSAGPEHETPKAFPQNTYYLLNTVADSVSYGVEAARALGLDAHVLTASLEGESREAGAVLASIAKEVQATGRPFTPPCVILSAGETTTRISDSSSITGHGGPGQELTARFALGAGGVPGTCMLSIDSEGTDGTTPVAGGITDSTSRRRAEEAGVDLHAALRGHATYEALAEIGDVVLTGNTGTNVCDFNVLYIPERPPAADGGVTP